MRDISESMHRRNNCRRIRKRNKTKTKIKIKINSQNNNNNNNNKNNKNNTMRNINNSKDGRRAAETLLQVCWMTKLMTTVYLNGWILRR